MCIKVNSPSKGGSEVVDTLACQHAFWSALWDIAANCCLVAMAIFLTGIRSNPETVISISSASRGKFWHIFSSCLVGRGGKNGSGTMACDCIYLLFLSPVVEGKN